MNAEQWPKPNLFPRMDKLGRFLVRLLSPMPLEAPAHMSEHYKPVTDDPQLKLEGLE